MPAEDGKEGFWVRLFCCPCNLVKSVADEEYPPEKFICNPPSKQQSKKEGDAAAGSVARPTQANSTVTFALKDLNVSSEKTEEGRTLKGTFVGSISGISPGTVEKLTK